LIASRNSPRKEKGYHNEAAILWSGKKFMFTPRYVISRNNALFGALKYAAW